KAAVFGSAICRSVFAIESIFALRRAVLALNPKNCRALLAIFWTARSASNRLVRPNLNIKKGSSFDEPFL
ncbi:MAG: hypothetical protein II814_05825, partial [Treponema sp.]|nr:hypothetical protein [Treponema sp.]